MSRMRYPPPRPKNFAAIAVDRQQTRFYCRSCGQWLPGEERSMNPGCVCKKCHNAISQTYAANKRRRLGLTE